MYMVVEIKEDKIVWNDKKVVDTKDIAQGRIEVFSRQMRHKQFSIIKLTKYRLMSGE